MEISEHVATESPEKVLEDLTPERRDELASRLGGLKAALDSIEQKMHSSLDKKIDFSHIQKVMLIAQEVRSSLSVISSVPTHISPGINTLAVEKHLNALLKIESIYDSMLEQLKE